MKPTWHRFSIRFLSLYFIGILALGLGVALFSRANLGVAPWDTAVINLRSLLQSQDISITLGQSSLIHTTFLLILVLLIGKRWQALLAIFSMLLISLSIDLWDVVILPILFPSPLPLWLSILCFLSALVIMTWGLATIIISGFPPNVYDDLQLTLIRVFKIKSFTLARWMIEFSGLLLGFIYAMLEGNGLGSITILSFLLAVAFGSFITYFVKLYQRLDVINRTL
ncbi:MAG: hypothetical protein FJ352_02580 [Firmicutes bacterium]|nr:hypothetical protein [Bacillota bacterium]